MAAVFATRIHPISQPPLIPFISNEVEPPVARENENICLHLSFPPITFKSAAMSAILSADDLNDFISPSVACIKPVETLPDPLPSNAYEVTTEGKEAQEARTAQISLTDCLACSGCVTSAEAVLVSMQSHAEVLNALDSAPAYPISQLGDEGISEQAQKDGKVFVASVSPQVRASLAATYRVSEKQAGAMIEQLLAGPQGLGAGGAHGNKFTWVFDTNNFRDLALAMSVEEVGFVSSTKPSKSRGDKIALPPKAPILSSACPGWICYAEKTHPYILPHLSKVKSPQALAGVLLKSLLSQKFGVDPAQIWHLAVMPCFDKKLEASRQELTDAAWRDGLIPGAPIRDVDCVVTAREIVMLADSRGISFPALPKSLNSGQRARFPDPVIQDFLFNTRPSAWEREPVAGSSGGYLYQVLRVQRDLHPGSTIKVEKGRNADVADYSLVRNGQTLFKGARYYGFRNIQNLVRKLKPARMGRSLPGGKFGGARKPNGASTRDMDYTYIEVMACPGGCTNGGGQIKISDLSEIQSPVKPDVAPKEWLAKVDEAYFSMDSDDDSMDLDAPSAESNTAEMLAKAGAVVAHWSSLTGVPKDKLIYTTYREVESDVGKNKADTEKVAVLAGKIGGGW